MSQALPLIMPLNEHWPILWKLADRLRELGYTEERVAKAMGVTDYSVRQMSLWPSHLYNCRKWAKDDPCGLLAAFFFIEESVPEQTLQELLGKDVVEVLDALFLIGQNDDGSRYFRYQLHPLHPLGDGFVLTDGHLSNPNFIDQVYPLGSDSHTLARMAPRRQVERSLDLCTGSGIHALLGALHSEHSFGLDINSRALDFACFNGIWNRLSAKFLESDCYQQVTSDVLDLEGPCQFDLITANPPFVPTPEKIALFRGGGATGEEVTERIVRGLPEMLKPDGIFSMVTNIPHFREHTFFQRCENWLGKDSCWSIVVLNSHYWHVPTYIASHLMPGTPTYMEDFHRWLESYQALQMFSLTNSQVYIFRSPYPWRIDRGFQYPQVPVSSFIEGWLASLSSWEQDGAPASYSIHPGIEKISWLEGRSKVFLEWDKAHRWWRPEGLWLEGPTAQALEKLQATQGGLTKNEVEPAALQALLAESVIGLFEEKKA